MLKVFILIFLAACRPSNAQDVSPTKAVEIWNELSEVPAVLAKSKSGQKMKELPNHFGKKIELAGFMVTNEFDSEGYSEFLLSRYPSGCVHVPLPPPSQMMYVKLSGGTKLQLSNGKRVVVEGVLKRSGRIDSAYELEAQLVKEWPL